MSKIDNHFGLLVVKDIEATRNALGITDKMTQRLTHAFPVEFQGPASCNGRHDIGDLETQSAVVGNGDLRQGDMHFKFTLGCDDVVAFNKQHAFALSSMGCQCWRFCVVGKKGDCAGALGSHGHDQRVLCVQNRHARWIHIAHDHALENSQIFNGRDVVQAKVVTTANIGDHRYLAFIKGQAFSQHATAGSFQYSCIDIGVHQDAQRTLWACTVA